MSAEQRWDRQVAASEKAGGYVSLLCSEGAHYLCWEGCACECHSPNPEPAGEGGERGERCKRQDAYDEGCAPGNTALVDCACKDCRPPLTKGER